MRSLVGFLTLMLVLLAAAAIALPAIARPLVESRVRAASPFGDQALVVEIDLDAFDLLQGAVGGIHLTGSDLGRDGVTIAALDVVATDVRIGDHPVATLAGSLDGVEIRLDDETSLDVRSIELSGPSTGLEAIAHFDAAQALAFVRHAFDQQGVSVGGIVLADGGITFAVFEQPVTVPLGVENGALVVPDLLGGGPLELLVPLESDPWRLTGVTVTLDGMVLHATVDAAGLLSGG